MLQFVLAIMATIHPSAPHTGYAQDYAAAIAAVVERDPAPEGWSPELGAATLAWYAWREGRYCKACRHHDQGGQVTTCALQVRAVSDGDAKALEASPVACVRRAYAVMRESVRLCGDLSSYVGGCRKSGPVAIARRRAAAIHGVIDAASR